jgi:predicted dehydrogenase
MIFGVEARSMLTIGVIGCGAIFDQYLTNLTTRFPGVLEVRACADLDLTVAKARAQEFGIAIACSPEELLADTSIGAVLNLTNPWAHAEVNKAALTSGKHVYAEKPLAMNRNDAQDVLSLGLSSGLRIGCAPDTFLGAGLQTCIKVIDEGWIGSPTAAHASISMPGHRMTPRYQSTGIGGVLLDMGPYYITALVALFGPVIRLAGFASNTGEAKTLGSMESAEYGTSFDVESPATVAGTLEFAGPVFAHLTTTVESSAYRPQLQIIGTDGVLTCNDPNMFGGPVMLERGGSEAREIPLLHQYNDRNRGLGIVEMLLAEEGERPHRASGELAFHVLDVMLGLQESSQNGSYLIVETGCDRPAPLRGSYFQPFGMK